MGRARHLGGPRNRSPALSCPQLAPPARPRDRGRGELEVAQEIPLPDMTDYAKRSFWLETCSDDLTPRAPLTQSIDVDVAILGGGYTGLWTAYYLLCSNSDLKVAVLEKEIVGFGASGRNGGWCSSKFPVTPSMLEQRYGREGARALMLAMNGALDEVSRFCQSESVDAYFHKGGILTLARGEHHLPMVRASFEAYSRLGLGEQYQLLSAEQALERVCVAKV